MSKIRDYDEIKTLEEAEDFVSMLGVQEEAYLLTAILKSLSADHIVRARIAADAAGFDLVEQ